MVASKPLEEAGLPTPTLLQYKLRVCRERSERRIVHRWRAVDDYRPPSGGGERTSVIAGTTADVSQAASGCAAERVPEWA
jgi:hypothetical protein